MQWMPPDSAESAKGIKDIDKIKRFLLDYYFFLSFSAKSYTIAFELLLLWTLLTRNFKDENIGEV
jgi:hypothetical protein